MESKNICMVTEVVAVVVVSMKCTIFESISTNTTIASCLPLVSGNCVIKSIDTWVQRSVGMDKGCNNPAFANWLALFLWQVSHDAIYFHTPSSIFGQYRWVCILA